jgi:hypothetical protein
VSLLTMEVLLNYLRSNGRIDNDWYRKTMSYVDENRGRGD